MEIKKMNFKETDKVVKKEKGRVSVVSKAKKQDTESYFQYEDFTTLQEKETAEHILSNYNRMERVDVINAANREETTPKAVTQLRRLAKAADEKTQAEIEKDIQAILDKHRAASAA